MTFRKSTRSSRRRTSRKRPVGKNRRRFSKRALIPVISHAPNGLPPRRLLKMTYSSDSFGSTTTVNIGFQQFRLNSLFDPDFTGGGHQPRGHDEWATLYKQYKVHACKCEVTGLVKTANTSGIVGVYDRGESSIGVADITQLREAGRAVSMVVNDQRPFRIAKYYRLANVFQIAPAQYKGDSLYSADMGASPAQQAFFSVYWQNADEVTSTLFHIRARLTYYVELFDPKVLAES